MSSTKAELLLAAARYLNETLELQRVYERFHELLAEAVPHNGVIVSSFDPETGLISADYAWVDGDRLDPTILPPLPLNREGGGMQSKVIVSGRPLLVNDVPEQVKKPDGVYYDVDREGHVRKLPEEGPPGVQAALMLPIKHEGEVVGGVQLMDERATYDEDQLALAEGLVSLMAAAVRNARLHEHAQEQAARRAAAEATAAVGEQSARVLEAVGDGVLYVRDDGVIRFWNRAAELVTGRAREEVIDRHAADVFSGWAAITGEIPVSEGSEPARPVTLPVELEGHELWLSFVAVRTEHGVVYAFRDLTVDRGLEAAKSDFIATVSHELRTPMTAVLGAAKTLLREDIELTPERRQQLLEMIGAQGLRLTQITEEVLLASRLDRGEIAVEQDRVDVAELTRRTVETMQPHISVAVTLVAPAEAFATGDRDRIQQVLINLLDNAAKYSPSGGGITVSVNETAEHKELGVTDEGVGIAPAEQEAIFEKFYRVDPHLSQTPGGTGLGLYISRELAQRMSGEIAVESQLGSGSTFVLELPRG